MWPSKVAAESAFENGLSKLLVGEGWGSGGSLPPVSIPEKSYEPDDDGRSLPPVAYLATVRGAVCYDTLILVFKLVISGCRIVSLAKNTPSTCIAQATYWCYKVQLATVRLFYEFIRGARFCRDFCVVRSLVNSFIWVGYVVDRLDFFIDSVSWIL